MKKNASTFFKLHQKYVFSDTRIRRKPQNTEAVSQTSLIGAAIFSAGRWKMNYETAKK